MTAGAAAYRAHTGRRIALVKRPGLSDLLRLRLYKPSDEAAASPVFAGNPDIFLHATPAERSSELLERLDGLFWRVLSRLSFEPWLDQALQQLCRRHASKTGLRYLYHDTIRFSYAAKILPDCMIWEDAPNAVAGMLKGFAEDERPPTVHPQLPGTFHGLDREVGQVKRMLAAAKLAAGDFIVVEPSTNLAWFGDLRAWPMENWQALVEGLREAFPDVEILQIGVDQGTALDGARDWRGKTTFRQAAALIQRSKLFIGTEGGLMHAARAVEAAAVIIWGGLTLPTFAGYPDRHAILVNEVSCAPCGLCGACPFDKACIRGISAGFAFDAVEQALKQYTPGLRFTSGSANSRVNGPGDGLADSEERQAC